MMLSRGVVRARRRLFSLTLAGVAALLPAVMVVATPQAASAAVRPALGTTNPTSLTFAAPQTGSQTLSVTLRNTGNSNLRLGGMEIDNAGPFSTPPGTCTGITLRRGQSCTASVTFDAGAAVRTYSNQLWFNDANGRAVALPVDLTATTYGGATYPAAIDYGSVDVGTVRAGYAMLTNTGDRDLTIVSDTFGEDPDAFTTLHDCTGVTLSPGQSCLSTLEYLPTLPYDNGDQYGTFYFLGPDNVIWGTPISVHGFAVQ